jgi:hypothetical protein
LARRGVGGGETAWGFLLRNQQGEGDGRAASRLGQHVQPVLGPYKQRGLSGGAIFRAIFGRPANFADVVEPSRLQPVVGIDGVEIDALIWVCGQIIEQQMDFAQFAAKDELLGIVSLHSRKPSPTQIQTITGQLGLFNRELSYLQ